MMLIRFLFSIFTLSFIDIIFYIILYSFSFKLRFKTIFKMYSIKNLIFLRSLILNEI